MRRALIAAVMAAGCSYREPTVGPGGPSGGDDTGPDAPGGNVPRTCPNDPELRLCVDFDGALTPTVSDGMNHVITAMNVTAMARTGDPAAHLDTTSQLFIQQSGAGDLDNVTNFTIEMWIAPDHRPMPTHTYWMLDNNNEYGIEYADDGRVRCVMSGRTVDSMTMVASGSWIHVACTYNLSHLVVYVDGAVDNCMSLTDPIMHGVDGVAIGANLGTGQVFADRFIGGLDNVRIYDRKLGTDEICTIAGHGTSCSHSCPGGGDGDD